jgi:glutathione S-transferase
MPVEPDAAIVITAFSRVPDFAKGLVRDLRVRWALEEAGLAYREKLLDADRSRREAYLREQPFGQVPAFDDGEVRMFEFGAIVLRIAEASEALSPRDALGRARTASWVLAALNSVEPAIDDLADIDLFHADADWAKERRPGAEQAVRERLGPLSRWLGERDHLEDRFTVGDLMMTSVLRILRHTDLIAEHPNLVRYQARCEARAAFRRALAAQLAAFDRPRAAA